MITSETVVPIQSTRVRGKTITKMAQPNAKRLKRSLKVRKSSFVVEKQDDSVSTKECPSVRTNVVASETSGIMELTRNSPLKCMVGDNNVADPAVSDSLNSLRYTLCQLLPGFLGVEASDWRNLPPLIIPSNVETTQETPTAKDEDGTTPSAWSPLPSVCKPCAMRTHCRHESPSINAAKQEASGTDNTEQPTGNASHHEQLIGNAPNHEQITEIRAPLDSMPGTSDVSSKPAQSKPLFKKIEPQPTTSSKPHRERSPLSESANGDANMELMNVQRETLAAAEPGTKQQNPNPITTCPICQTRFDVNLSPVDIDGHIAACFAASDDDSICLPKKAEPQRMTSPSKSRGVKRPHSESLEMESSFELLSSQHEAMAADESDRKQQNPIPITTCPLCETRFDMNLSQVDIDGHIAACLAAAEDDGASLPKSGKPQTRTSSSKSGAVKRPLPESPDRNTSDASMSFEQEAIAVVEPKTQQQKLTPLTTCPLCQTRFDVNLSPVDIDGHIAACFAAAADDVTW